MNPTQRIVRLVSLIASIVAFALISSIGAVAHADSPTPTTTLENSKIAYISNWSIYVMNADGSAPQCLTLCDAKTADEHPSIAPAWSHDGEQIAFKGHRTDSDADAWGIFVMNADGSHLRRLTDIAPCGSDVSGDPPSWSPDDSQIVFSQCYDQKSALDIVNADGSGLKPLVASGTPIDAPIWSPDGQVIAFAASQDIDAIASDGSHQRTLAKYGFSPSWSPDGIQIAFVSFPDQPGGTPSLSIMDADGSHVRKLYQGTNFVDSPTWSPDGQSIAFMAQPDTANDSYYDGNIYRINVDGTALRQLTHDGGLWPSWSHLLLL